MPIWGHKLALHHYMPTRSNACIECITIAPNWWDGMIGLGVFILVSFHLLSFQFSFLWVCVGKQ
jgi:hypothetical protein